MEEHRKQAEPEEMPPRLNEVPVSGSGGEERLREAEAIEGREPHREGATPNPEE